MGKFAFILFIALHTASYLQAQIRVSDNNRFLAEKDGTPFFWIGDTDWEMAHRLTREEVQEVIDVRSKQGFNVLQVVALAEFNGIREPNRYGDYPLNNEDPTQLLITPGNDSANSYQYDYWDHLDFIIKKAAEKNIYIGLLPTWGDKVTLEWGEGPVIFNSANAEKYAEILAKRYAKDWNIIWILGGDRPAQFKNKEGVEVDHREIWRAMARGIESTLGKETFITYHPSGGPHSTSSYIHAEPWLDMNAFQSGHGSREIAAWDLVRRDLSLKPPKPTLDMEPCYEDHPVNPWDGKWTRARGYFNAYDVRARIYRGIFAGGCGVTYGHHQVWQFLNERLYPKINVGDTIIGWQRALHAEAATQLIHLRNLMLSRPYFTRIDGQQIIKSTIGKDYKDIVYATIDQNKSFAFVYLPLNKPVKIDMQHISGQTKNILWFDPRTGQSTPGKAFKGNGVATLKPPSQGNDWVLIIDDASKNYPTPEVAR
jgi:hypothetical protein